MLRLTTISRLMFATLATAASVWLVGCGGTKDGQLPTAQVSGHVSYRGAPLGRGEVKFIPVQAGAGARVAYGTLNEQGSYRLGTYGRDDGAILGDYQVTVESRAEISADAAQHATKHDLARAKPLISERYADPSKSGLTAHVTEGGNTFNFDLKD